MKIIRTKGIAGLLIVVVSVFLLLFVFADGIAKYLFESQLTAANGAEANVDNVQVSYWPFRVELKRLQLTDSDSPEKNLLEIEKAGLEIDSDSLLKGRFILNELKIDKIEFATRRAVAGKVVKTEKEENNAETEEQENSSLLAEASIDLPDIDDLIAKAELESDKAFEAATLKADETKQSWNEIKTSLDEKEKWKALEDRFKALKRIIKNGKTKEKLKALKELKVLNREIKAELAVFRTNKRKLQVDYNALEKAIKQARSAPKRDLEKLKSSYSLDEKNLANYSRLLFDAEISHYIELAHKYYKKIEPYLQSDEDMNQEARAEIQRQEGRLIKFKEDKPEPDFLIKKAAFTMILPSGLFAGEASNIAIDQHINKKPAVLTLTGRQLKHSEEELIKLVLDYRDRKKSRINLKYDIKQRNISQYKISGGSTLPLIMETAVVDMKSDISIENGKLAGGLNSQFNTVQFSSSEKETGKGLSSLLVSAMKNIHNFDINANVKGRISSPKIKLDSDIDNKINKSLKTGFNKIKKDYESKLKTRLNEKYKDEIREIDSDMADIKKFRQELENRQNKLEEKLKTYKK